MIRLRPNKKSWNLYNTSKSCCESVFSKFQEKMLYVTCFQIFSRHRIDPLRISNNLQNKAITASVVTLLMHHTCTFKISTKFTIRPDHLIIRKHSVNLCASLIFFNAHKNLCWKHFIHLSWGSPYSCSYSCESMPQQLSMNNKITKRSEQYSCSLRSNEDVVKYVVKRNIFLVYNRKGLRF